MALRRTGILMIRFQHFMRRTNSCIHTSGIQRLFAAEFLGLDSFNRQRAAMQTKVGNLQDVFRDRMKTYLDSEENAIFTGDLKSMVYLASNDLDLELIEQMIIRFRKQRQELKISEFVFGPIVMRLLHHLNKPDLAMHLFMMEPRTDGFFDQIATFSTLMDLHFEEGRYDDVLKVMSIVKERQVGGYKYPSDCFVLFAAACCKKNTKDTYTLLLNEIEEAGNTGHKLSLRTYTYVAYLALQQGDAKTALEIIDARDYSKGRVPVVATNLKVLALTHLGRLEDAIFELQCLLNQDSPDTRIHDVFVEVVQRLKVAVDEKGDTVLNHKMTELGRSLEENHHTNPQNFEEYIYGPIIRRRQAQDGYKNRRRPGAFGYSKSSKRGLQYSEDLA